ncbi:hypothetical protein ABW21_db0205555 [Orbilia brochopaga]|nr:hypothetical protein ABW21_db0205555 [Drechslerella brochopaga]
MALHSEDFYHWPDAEWKKVWASARAQLLKVDQSLLTDFNTVCNMIEQFKETKNEWQKYSVDSPPSKGEMVYFNHIFYKTVDMIERMEIRTEENRVKQILQRIELLKLEREARLRDLSNNEQLREALNDIAEFYMGLDEKYTRLVQKHQTMMASMEWLRVELKALKSAQDQH